MPDPIDVKEACARAWHLFARNQFPTALVPDWRTSTAEDGKPQLSAQVVGEQAQEALHNFASGYPLVLGHDGLRPVVEYRPGRVVCVWRTGGVWVELWHPDAPAAPEPSLAVMPKRRFSPSARLPFARRPQRGAAV